MTASAAALKLEISVVTKDELLELAEWERKHAERKKKAAESEREVEFRRLAVAEKVLGVKTSDELKRLSPEQVMKLYQRRWEHEEWKSERGAPEFQFVQTNAGRYPSWRDQYVGVSGETAAARISADTPTTYSYCVTVSLP